VVVVVVVVVVVAGVQRPVRTGVKRVWTEAIARRTTTMTSKRKVA